MKTIIKKQNILKRGQVMILTTIFFVVFTSSICLGLINPIVEQIKSSNYYWDLSKSYYTTEAGVEDAIYRLKDNLNMSENETTKINQLEVANKISEQDGNHIILSVFGDDKIRIELKKSSEGQPFEILDWRGI